MLLWDLRSAYCGWSAVEWIVALIWRSRLSGRRFTRGRLMGCNFGIGKILEPFGYSSEDIAWMRFSRHRRPRSSVRRASLGRKGPIRTHYSSVRSQQERPSRHGYWVRPQNRSPDRRYPEVVPSAIRSYNDAIV